MIKPWLFVPPKLAHDLTPFVLQPFSKIFQKDLPEWQAFNWRDLHFSNPLGIAGGVDKNADHVLSWSRLGAGFIEIGTITPKPQTPNPGKIMDRNVSKEALWNKMGFPSKGVNFVIKNIKRQISDKKNLPPFFVNIGKNRTTPNDLAFEDYVSLINDLISYADAFVVNVSSPNTKGLRHLLEPSHLNSFLKPIMQARTDLCLNFKLPLRPVILKISPDMKKDEFLSVIETSLSQNIDGWILTNTTTQYDPQLGFSNKGGGVSGRPLAQQSKSLLKLLVSHFTSEQLKDKLIISSGGVLSLDDVYERLKLGAHLVQCYSALVFNGPLFFQKIVFEGLKREKTESYTKSD